MAICVSSRLETNGQPRPDGLAFSPLSAQHLVRVRWPRSVSNLAKWDAQRQPGRSVGSACPPAHSVLLRTAVTPRPGSKERRPQAHSKDEEFSNFSSGKVAELDFEPICSDARDGSPD